MAIMIPDVCPLEWGKRNIQKTPKRLQYEWLVCASFPGYRPHLRQERGEADFIVIVPHKGILCLEVKGASSVRRADGKWFYGSSNKGETRSPFKQASEAMVSVKKPDGISSVRASMLTHWLTNNNEILLIIYFTNDWKTSSFTTATKKSILKEFKPTAVPDQNKNEEIIVCLLAKTYMTD